VPLTSALVMQMFGFKHMSMLLGLVFLSHQLGSFTGAWLGGYIFDVTGSYDYAWWISVALGIASSMLHWPIDERPVGSLASAH
jgi:predicted MFS family arabinose efflux permease